MRLDRFYSLNEDLQCFAVSLGWVVNPLARFLIPSFLPSQAQRRLNFLLKILRSLLCA
jgi:hypothetical protein